jgi:hypothetical protein
MKSAMLLLLCAFVCASAGAAGKDHPVVKVIKLLEGLKADAISQGKTEAVAYEKFTYWCSTSKAELNDAIADEKETIDELKDTIAGKTKQQASLEKQVEDLEDQLKELEASALSAKKDRKAEAALYDKANKDLASTITAVDGCIKALEGAEATTEPGMLLAQSHVQGLIGLISMKATTEQVSALATFAAPRPTQEASGDLAKHTDKYDFKSENVIELLKTLKLKFEDDQLAGTKAETNSLNAYELSKEARDNTIDAATDSKKKRTTELGSTKGELADAKKNKKNTEQDLDADTNTLKATGESCSTKKSEWEARSKTRSGEIEAIETAVTILGKATGVRTAAPGNPIPPASPVKFLQVLSLGSGGDPKMKAVALLRAAATDAHSKALERLAMEVAAHLNGPFDAVNNMVEKMIFRLKDEQKNEDEHKLWCDEEIEKTNTMKDDKTDKIKELKADIKEENSKVVELTSEIKSANQMVSDIDSFVKEATEIRNTGKKENALAIKDSQDAQVAVSNAIAVLTAFYKDSGSIAKEPWEFIQAPAKLPKNPATWDSPYTEVSDPTKQPGGIISVLETINADFSKMEAETKSQEEVDQKEFEAAMKENAIEKAGRSKESDMKNAEKARRVDRISSLESSKKDTSAELEKTNQYLEDLKPACVDGDSSYDDRKAARTKEIEALKKAQIILLDAFKNKPSTKFLQLRAVNHH